jgi:LAGLIDADG endonuclease
MSNEEKAYNRGAQSNGTNSSVARAPNVSVAERNYIAGFLDGDGSIMAQLVSRKDYKLGYQIRVSVVFCQKNAHRKHLLWLKEQLSYGYVRIRNDGMCEYTIVGLREVQHVLALLYPFLRLKKSLAAAVMALIDKHPPQRKMTARKLIQLSKQVDRTAMFNYSKKRTVTSAVVMAFLNGKGMMSP